jgi:hypothetical protein
MSDGIGVDDAGATAAGCAVGDAATGGWSGAFGFFTCVAAYAYDAARTSSVVTAEPTFSAHSATYAAAFTKGMRSKLCPRISFASTPRCDARISWYTARKSTAYARFPSWSSFARFGVSP